MRKLLSFVVALFLLPLSIKAQGVSHTNIAWYNSAGTLRVAPSALITVCAANNMQIPCAPTTGISLYKDYLLSNPLSNPFNADANGNYTFFVTPGNYTITVTGVGVVGYSYQWAVTNGSYLASPPPIGSTTPNTVTATALKATTSIQGITFAGLGTSVEVATLNCTTVAANLPVGGCNGGSGTLYAVPVGQAGIYRPSCYIVLTQAASVSSTLPACNIGYTDADTSIVDSTTLLETNTANTQGSYSVFNVNFPIPTLVFNAKAGTNITFSTGSYSSNGATPMQYAIHIRLEYLGQ